MSETTNKLYVAHGKDSEDQLAITTSTYTDIDDLINTIDETLKKAGHADVMFSYSRQSSKVSVAVPKGKTCLLKKDSSGVVLGVGEISSKYEINGSHTFPYAVNLSKGRSLVLLHTDLIVPFNVGCDSSPVFTLGR